jgi:hypothetical protein
MKYKKQTTDQRNKHECLKKTSDLVCGTFPKPRQKGISVGFKHLEPGNIAPIKTTCVDFVAHHKGNNKTAMKSATEIQTGRNTLAATAGATRRPILSGHGQSSVSEA